ncbi:MAG: proline dehydrogenase family protein [bacterium]
MGVARKALLWISENRKLRQSLPKYRFIQRAVKRFMPGERLEDAIAAAQQLKANSLNTIFTLLGENVADKQEAKQIVAQYLMVLDEVHKHGLDTYISVKPTQLGLDFDMELCYQNLVTIVERAGVLNNLVWLDMEQSQYVDRTLELYKRVKTRYPNVGICLQAYLYRTKRDLESLFTMQPLVRLVKGAYLEPANIAYPMKKDVDENYFQLVKMMLEKVKSHNVTIGVGTHDTLLARCIQQTAKSLDLSKTDYEFQMLYGIKSDEQLRLTGLGYKVRLLISYGTFWFPWYIRRLAERPANVWFVVKNIFP